MSYTTAVMSKGEPDFDKKSCYDCRKQRAYLSWWCMDKEANEYWGTPMPSVTECPFWKPVDKLSDLSFLDKYLGDYIKIEGITMEG